MARHGGTVPADLAALLDLPGVGSYTARAVAAFAYGQRHPVVDTNVRRLVARAYGGAADGGPATTAADLATVEALLPATPARAARASAAFMEIGALVCTARAPACPRCPLARRCAWRAAGRPPAPDRPGRRSQRYVGTDRHVRGIILGLARAGGVIDRTGIEAAWPDAEQRQRALSGLVSDGLLIVVNSTRYGLPGVAASR